MQSSQEVMVRSSGSEARALHAGVCVLAVAKSKKGAAPASEFLSGLAVIDVVSVKGRTATVARRGKGKAQPEPIEWFPAHCIAIVEDGSNPELMAQVKRWLAGASPKEVPVVDVAKEPGKLTELLLQRCETAMVRNAQLSRDLAVLRGVHEETQNAYNVLRTYVQSNGLHLPQLAFINSPSDAYEGTPGNARIIQQELPLPTRDIAAIGVYVAAKPDRRAQGTVTFRLVAVEGQEVLSTWVVPLPRLPNGLVSLVMDKVSAYSRKTAHLLITIEESAGFAGPEFAVGAAQPRTDKCVRVDGALQESSLAFCLWRALPGTYVQATHAMGHVITPVPVKQPAAPTVPGQAAGQGAPKGPRVLKAARVQDVFLDLSVPIDLIDVLGVQKQRDEVMLKVDPEKRHILVRPAAGGPSVGRIRDVCRPGMRSVSADVFVARDQAGPVEFALAMAKGDRFDASGLGGDDPHSGWIRVEAGDLAALRIDLPSPLEEAYDLFLCTRLPAGSMQDSAVAQFQRVIFSGTFGA